MTVGQLIDFVYDPALPGPHQAELAAWLLAVLQAGLGGCS